MKAKEFKTLGLALAVSAMSISGVSAQDANSGKKDTLRLSIDQAVKIALDQNPTVVVDSMEIVRTNFAKKETLGSLYPSVSFIGSYTRSIKKQQMSFAGQTMEVGSDNSTAFGFQASMPLINVPLWKSIALTEENINAKIESARETQINMVSTITEAYYQLLNAKDSYKVLQEAYNTAAESHRITTKKFQQGMTSEYDTIQTSVQLRSIEPNLIATRNGIDLATLQLKILMGIPDDYPVSTEGSLEDYEKTMFNEIKMSDVDTTLKDNPTVRQLEVSTRLLEKQLNVTKAQWYPTLSLSFLWEWMALGNGEIGEFNPYSTLGLSLNFPIFQGGSRYYKQKEAQLQYDEMKYTLDDTKRQLKLGLQNSMNSLKVAIQSIESTKASVESAQKGYDISKKRYEVGSGTTLEMTTSQNSLTQAKLSFLQAIYDYIVAKDAVDKVLGNAYNAYVK